MKQILQKCTKVLLFSCLVFASNITNAQPWTYDFGTGTGTHPTNTASTSFLTDLPSGGGTYRVRTGGGGGTIIRANPGTSLGSGSELNIVSSTSTSANKFGVYTWNSLTTVAAVKYKFRTTSGGNGNLNFSLGTSGLGSDSNGYASSYNSALTSITIAYGSGNISSVVRRINGINTTINSSGFTKDTDHTVEVYANNGSSTVNYVRNGTSYSLATRTWDFWLDNVRIVNNGATAGSLTVNTNLSGFAFYAESSTSNSASIFIDDLEYSNALPTNAPPVASNVAFTGTLNTTQTLTGSYTYTDEDSDVQGTSTFKWYRADNASGLNEAAISGATNQTYTLGNDDLNKFISFGVVPVASTGTSPGIEVKSTYQGPINDAAATSISVVQSLTSFVNTCINQSSVSQNYSVSASNLTEDLTITAPTHFEISANNSTWSNSLNLVPVSGVVNATTIYVRFSPTATEAQTGSINHTSAGAATQSITLGGTGINTAPTITSPTSASITANSVVLGGNITDLGCNSVTTRGVEYSTTNNFENGVGTIVSETGTYATGTFTLDVTGLTSGTTYYYKVFATSSSGTSYSLQGTFTTSAISAAVASTATGVDATSFTATWNAVTGATSYEIDVYVSSVILATDLFISEYGEGAPGNRKYVEIFNGTGGSVDLSQYKIFRATNGGGWPVAPSTAILSLTGTLANGQTYVIANNATDTPGADIYSTDIANWNGDDAIGLFKNDILIDVFGIPTSDPGSGWAIAGSSNATVDKIIVRKSTIVVGNTNWSTSAGSTVENSEWIISRVWDATDSSTPSTLGSHTFNSESHTYHIQNQDVGNVTFYQVTGLAQNTTYYYVVRAIDATSESENSNEISTTTAIVSSTWNGTTWSNGAPTSTVDAIIDGDYTETADISCKDLTINSGNTLTIGASNSLTVAGNLVNDGNLIFKSTSAGTARFASYSGAAITSSNVTVERYLPARRAWRLLTAPLKGSSSNTIGANWQGTANEGLLLFSPATYLSQTMTGYTTGGSRPNIWKYNSASTQWQSITDISAENLFSSTVNNGFLVFATGPHGSNTIASSTTAEATTLKPKGELITGTVNYTGLTAGQFHLLGNPYASPIDVARLRTSNESYTFYLLDPSLGDANSRGGYYTYNGSWAPNTPSNALIQSGQGFFVKSASATTFDVAESHKDSGNSNIWFDRTTADTSFDKIRVLLFKQDNSAWYLADGILAVNSASGNHEVDAADADKMTNFNENLLFKNGTSNLAIEYRGLPAAGTLQPMQLTGTSAQPYELRIKTENYSNSNLTPYLENTQTGVLTEIPTDGSEVIVPFTGIAATSAAPDSRFRIVYQSPLSADDLNSLVVGVYPNPVQESLFTIELANTNATASYTLTNLLGQEVQKGTLMALTNTIPVHDLSEGVYLLQVNQEGKRFTTKLMIK